VTLEQLEESLDHFEEESSDFPIKEEKPLLSSHSKLEASQPTTEGLTKEKKTRPALSSFSAEEETEG